MALTLPPDSALTPDFLSIYLVVLSEPIASTMLFPFVVFMLRDFGYSEAEVGSRAGLVASAFCLAQALTTPLWSLASNRIGRRPTLLLGLLSSATTLLLFGLSRSLAAAVAWRALCGALSGNTALARTVVAELCVARGIPLPKAFSYLSLSLALGWVAGPLLGGLLSNAHAQYGWSGPANLFSTYPYLLPCAASAAWNVLALSFAALALPETAPRAAVPDAEAREEDSENEETPLIRKVSITTALADGPPASLRTRFGPAIAMLSSATVFFMGNIMFDELFPLYLSSSAGWGMDSVGIARALAGAGPAMILATLCIPRVLRSGISTLALYRGATVVLVGVYACFPLTGGARDWPPAGATALLLGVVALRAAAMMGCVTMANVVTNDVVSPEDRALVNGVGQSATSLARAFGPALGGVVWQAGVLRGAVGWPFALLVVIGCLQGGLSFLVRK